METNKRKFEGTVSVTVACIVVAAFVAAVQHFGAPLVILVVWGLSRLARLGSAFDGEHPVSVRFGVVCGALLFLYVLAFHWAEFVR